jgi:hypothetical protein
MEDGRKTGHQGKRILRRRTLTDDRDRSPSQHTRRAAPRAPSHHPRPLATPVMKVLRFRGMPSGLTGPDRVAPAPSPRGSRGPRDVSCPASLVAGLRSKTGALRAMSSEPSDAGVMPISAMYDRPPSILDGACDLLAEMERRGAAAARVRRGQVRAARAPMRALCHRRLGDTSGRERVCGSRTRAENLAVARSARGRESG